MPNSIHFVLSSPKGMLSLLSTNQSQTFEKLLYRFLSIYFISAYRNKSQSTACFISLTYSRNDKVPNIDPWGTPQSTFAMQEYLPEHLVKNFYLKCTIETNLLSKQKI